MSDGSHYHTIPKPVKGIKVWMVISFNTIHPSPFSAKSFLSQETAENWAENNVLPGTFNTVQEAWAMHDHQINLGMESYYE